MDNPYKMLLETLFKVDMHSLGRKKTQPTNKFKVILMD